MRLLLIFRTYTCLSQPFPGLNRMMNERGQTSAAKAGGGPPVTGDFKSLVAKFSAKDRHSVERQLVARENSPVFGLAERWQRVVETLLILAPGIVKMTGTHTMQFYIADGKYRKQVFAVYTTPEGEITVCIPDIIDDAVAAGFIEATPMGEAANDYRIVGSDETLKIDIVDGKTIDPQVFYKDMTGWNRRALCVILPPDSTRTQLRAVDDLCKLAAVAWAALIPDQPLMK